MATLLSSKVDSSFTETVTSLKSYFTTTENATSITPPAESPPTEMPDASATPLTVDSLIRQRAQEVPDLVLVAYPSAGIEYVDYTAQQLDVLAFRAAQRYAKSIPQRTSSSDPERVVALLGPSNFEYFITMLALTKLGHSILFLSTRISNEAYLSLLKATGSGYIVVDKSFEDVAVTLSETIPTLTTVGVQELVTEAQGDEKDTAMDSQFDLEEESKKISWIIHSSGSTGLPKPIYQTHAAALRNYANNMGLKGFVTLPLYHAHGISSLFRSISACKQIHLWNATLPLTYDYLLNILRQNAFEIFYGVPYALKILGETEEGMAELAKLKVVMFGGSACPDSLGNRLVDHDVNLISHYGTTETGQLMTSFRPTGDKDWNYVRTPAALKPYISFEMRSEGIFELVALKGLPSLVASNRPDGSYATKDLFQAHPTTPDAWKYYARLDDTIAMLNGEKTNPTSFEHAIRDDKLVAEAVIFGNSKPRLGMMIIASAAASGMTEDEVLTALRPALDKANDAVPGYAKLTPEMIGVLPSGTEYPRTDKGTVIRAAFYRTFEKLIDAVYDRAETASGDLVMSEEELREFLRGHLVKQLALKDPSSLKEDTDFFSLGVDSLQAIQLRGILAKNIQTNGQKLGSNIVFDFPTLQTLARHLYCLRTGETAEVESTEVKMANLIEKYSAWEKHVPVENERQGRYLVVTGATGSLGAHVVAQLIKMDDVVKVYCPVRGSGASGKMRVISSLQERALYHNLSPAARRKITTIPGDFSKANLGLDSETYEKVASEITALIHCAWAVNFNLGLGSFEADCIAGAHNLIQLCLKAKRPQPASFNFCSSVSAVATTKGGFVPEALPKELSYAQNMGYAQGKLVTENICNRAAEQTGMLSRVLRVGQVIGDTVHGIWNDTEAIPMILQAATTIGAVPKLDENPLWLPVDVVANAVVDIAFSDAPAPVTNIVNHQSFHWTRDLLPAAHKAGLDFKELGQKEWVDCLRKSNPDPAANPPIKLIEFFASKYDNDKPKSGLAYDTTLARSLSPALANAPIVNDELVSKFVAHWKKVCWNVTADERAMNVVVLAGPCGAGKSTAAHALSEEYHVPWIEGDILHSDESLAKMTRGEALVDGDRWAWLDKIKTSALETLETTKQNTVLVTCSALKRDYREHLRHAGDKDVRMTFFMLQGGKDTLRERMSQRQGHYMKAEMVDVQVDTLESPGTEETDVIPVDVSAPKEEVLKEVSALFKNIRH